MKISNKIYDILKWVSIIAIPAVVLFITTISNIWNIQFGDEISATVAAIGLLIGGLIGVSTYNYNKENMND